MTLAEEPIVRLILEANLCPRPARSNGLPHAGAKATEATASEAAEAATAAPRYIAGTPTHGYEPRGRVAAFAKN